MGFVHVDLTLSNSRTGDAALHATALVDTGVLHLCLPESLARQMDLAFDRFRRVTYADGRSLDAPYVGPVMVEIGDRECYVGAMVFGDEVLLGAIPMEDMDLLVDPPPAPGNPAGSARAGECGQMIEWWLEMDCCPAPAWECRLGCSGVPIGEQAVSLLLNGTCLWIDSNGLRSHAGAHVRSN